MTRTLGAAVLAASLVAATVTAAPPTRTENENADEAKEEAAQAARFIQPTPAELELFQLPRPELTPSAPSPVAFQASGWAMFAASGADMATTEWGLSRGLAEGNPVATNRTARILHHVVGPAAVWYTTEKLHKSGKKKLALTLRIALMAAYSYAAVHNTRQIGGVAP